jgi:hypothetical protein
MDPAVILLVLAAAALFLLLGKHRRPPRPADAGPAFGPIAGPIAGPVAGLIAGPEPTTPGAPVAASAPTAAGAPMAVGAPAPAAHFPTTSAAARRHRNTGASHFTRPRANARVAR